MRFLFDTPAFSFEALRVAGYAPYGGADLGEVLVTARRVREGDAGSWHPAWSSLAEHLEGVAETALGAGHPVSARESFLRASAYYRTAELFLRDDPARDPEVARLGGRVRRAFASAAALMGPRPRSLRIPFEDVHLPGYLFTPHPGEFPGPPWPTVVYQGGFDAVLEEAYFAMAVAATRRGYACVAFDGPGQGTVLRLLGLPFRPESETVVGAVIDEILTRPEIDPSRIVLVGARMGGFLAARAAAHDPRLAACVLRDTVWDLHAAAARALPTGVVDAADRHQDADVDRLLDDALDPDDPSTDAVGLSWFLGHGRWALDAASTGELIRATRSYTLDGLAQHIHCPTLVLEAEDDVLFDGQSAQLDAALTCPHDHVVLSDAIGDGKHGRRGSMLTVHHVVFDWLADNLHARRTGGVATDVTRPSAPMRPDTRSGNPRG